MTLSRVRIIAAAVLVAAMTVLPAAADMKAANAAYGKLLAKYVSSRGVKYAAWRANGDDLKMISEVVMTYRNTDTMELDPNERKALLINLYNSKILETVLLQNPSGSIRALSKWLRPNEIFDRPAMMLDGKLTTLNGLEKRLRDEFKDPRIHFAINCASRSCPPIRVEPYGGTRIEDQLDAATRAFLASPAGIELTTARGETTLRVSALFDWYADDFKAVGGALPFIGMYGPKDAAEAAGERKTKLAFQPYDWSLNVSD
jgi:hypothetical protein